MLRVQSSLKSVAPLNLILMSGLLYLALVIAVTGYLTQGPWLGLSIDLDNEQTGVLVKSVEKSVIGNKLDVGDRILAISDDAEEWVEIGELAGVADPDSLDTYETYNEFFVLQELIWNELRGDQVFLRLENSEIVTLEVKPARPISDLPLTYWMLTLLGFLAAAIGAVVWAYRVDELAPVLLAVSGLFLFLGTITNLHLFRELALDPVHFKFFANVNYIAMAGTAYSWILILLHYPKRLVRFTTIKPIFLWVFLIGINGTWQLLEPPVHAFYYHYLVAAVLMSLAAWSQWVATRNSPLERAALQWLVLSMAVSSGMVVLLYILPVILSGVTPVIDETVTFIVIFGFYVGVTLGIVRFRLFNLEKWWFETWLFIAGFVVLIALDSMLVYLLQFARPTAFGIAFVVVLGWIYIPLRLKFRRLTQRKSQRNLEHHVPMLINTLFASTASIDQDKKWEAILDNVFSPLEIESLDFPSTEINLSSEGAVMLVPAISAATTYSLSFRDRGSRIFSLDDVELAENLMSLTRTSYSVKEAQELGAREERDRIMRDFHDDVASYLLTLVQRAPDAETVTLSKNALKALKDAIYSLDAVDHRSLSEVLYEVRYDCAQRMLDKQIELEWKMDELDTETTISSRQNVNFRRIMQEIVSNVLQHSAATRARVDVEVKGGSLYIKSWNNGVASPTTKRTGKGLMNIKVRVGELDGDVDWCIDEETSSFTTELSFPLH